MSLRSLVRRTTAVTAATALLTAGGAASGALVSSAYAAPLPAAIVTSSGPVFADNRSSVAVTAFGSGFVPGDVVILRPFDVLPYEPASSGPEVGDLSSGNAIVAPTAKSIKGTVDLTMAPPGRYYVVVEHVDSTDSVVTPSAVLTVVDYGAASVRSVAAGVDSNGTTCDPFGIFCGRGGNALDITGSNFARGAFVQFLLPTAPFAPDPALSFTPGNPGNGTPPLAGGTGYPSTTLLQGNYSYVGDAGDKPAFVPGRHLLKVVNTYPSTGHAKDNGATVDFWQPWFSPNSLTTSVPQGSTQAVIGAGAQNVTVTLKGRGFRPGSKLSIQGHSYSFPTSCKDLSVSSSTLSAISPPDANGNDSMLVAKVNAASCTAPGTRGVTVTGPDSASFTRSNVLTVTPPPVADGASFGTLGQGANHYTGFTQQTITVTGTAFAASATPSPSTCPSFSFGPGTTSTTIGCPNANQATVVVDVAPDAATGDRSVTVTNPDDGASSTTNPDTTPLIGFSPLTIDAGPAIKSISQTSFTQNTVTPVTVIGSNFDKSMTLDVLDPADPTRSNAPKGVFISNVKVTPHSTTGSLTGSTDDTLTFTVTVDGSAPANQALFVLTNQNDHGMLVCATCFGVDSLSVTPTNAPNTGPVALSLSAPGNPPTVPAMTVGPNSTVKMVRTLPASGQGPIPGTGLAAGLPPGTATASFDLKDAAPGQYNVTVVQDSTNAASPKWSCTGCFSITSQGLSGVTLAPTQGGQGAMNLPIKITGNNFSKGMTVAIDAVKVHDIVFHPAVDAAASYLTAFVDVPSSAPTGGHDVVVSAADGKSSVKLTGGFTINPPPSPSSVTAPSSKSYGQGAHATSDGKSLTLSVTGTNIEDGATLSLGAGIDLTNVTITHTAQVPPAPAPAVTPAHDDMTATIVISQGAATGPRDVVVHNPDGGVGTIARGFTVNTGPKVLSVGNEAGDPMLRPDGLKHTITIVGGGFSTTSGNLATVAITPADNIKIENVTVVSDKQITADVTVDTTAARGARTVGVTNPADGGYGDCTVPGNCPYVAVPPGTAAPVVLSPGAQSIKVTWHAAAPNGAPVTSYHVTITRAGGSPSAVDVTAPALTYTFTGLTNGATYTVTVAAVNAAVNAAHPGPVTTASAIAGVKATLTAVASSKLITYGGKVTLTGRLLHGTTPLVGKTIVLSFVPAVGSKFTAVVTTSSTGTWSKVVSPVHSFKVQAIWPGDSTYAIAYSPYAVVAVAARVTVKAPLNRSTSAASSLLTISGVVAPSKAGKVVYLYRYLGSTPVLVAKATLNKYSQFVFSIRPGRGTYVFRVFIPAVLGNAAGYSPALTLYRV